MCTSTARQPKPHPWTPHTFCSGTGWKPHYSEGNGYCGTEAARLQTKSQIVSIQHTTTSETSLLHGYGSGKQFK